MATRKSPSEGLDTKIKAEWFKVAVVNVSERKESLSIPLRFLSLDIYCAYAVSSKAWRTSRITGKNDGKSIPLARQILVVVMITAEGTVHVFIT